MSCQELNFYILEKERSTTIFLKIWSKQLLIEKKFQSITSEVTTQSATIESFHHNRLFTTKTIGTLMLGAISGTMSELFQLMPSTCALNVKMLQ